MTVHMYVAAKADVVAVGNFWTPKIFIGHELVRFTSFKSWMNLCGGSSFAREKKSSKKWKRFSLRVASVAFQECGKVVLVSLLAHVFIWHVVITDCSVMKSTVSGIQWSSWQISWKCVIWFRSWQRRQAHRLYFIFFRKGKLVKIWLCYKILWCYKIVLSVYKQLFVLVPGTISLQIKLWELLLYLQVLWLFFQCGFYIFLKGVHIVKNINLVITSHAESPQFKCCSHTFYIVYYM